MRPAFLFPRRTCPEDCNSAFASFSRAIKLNPKLVISHVGHDPKQIIPVQLSKGYRSQSVMVFACHYPALPPVPAELRITCCLWARLQVGSPYPICRTRR
jgi:hypothetical protein